MLSDLFLQIKRGMEEAIHELDTKTVYPVVGEHTYFECPNTARVWIYVDNDWEWGVLSVHLVGSDSIPCDHALSYEMHEAGTPLSEILFDRPEDIDTELLALGVAPGQRFEIKVTARTFPEYSEGYVDGYSTEFSWEFLRCVPWTNEQAATAWEALMGRRHLLIG